MSYEKNQNDLHISTEFWDKLSKKGCSLYMPNYLPYLILILVSIFILTYTIINQRQFGVFVLLISFSGMVYVAEFFVMVIGNCYYYKPEILSVPYYDNILGAIVSNLFILPALGVFAAYYKLRLKWIILFAITLVGVELAFEAMNIYYTNWWRSEFTFIAVILFIFLCKFFMRVLQRGSSWARFIMLWMHIWCCASTVMYIMSVVNIRHYEYGFFEDIYHDDIFLSASLGFIKGLIYVVCLVNFNKFRWRMLAPIMIFVLDLPLYHFGVLVVNIPFWIYTILYVSLATILLVWTQYAYSYLMKLATPPT